MHDAMTVVRRAGFPAVFWVAVAAAQEVPDGGVVLSRSWIAAPPPGAATAAGYLAIANDGETADRLLSVSAGFAGKAEIHGVSIDAHGVMRMRPVEGGLTLAPGETVILEPGGYHVMFTGVLEPLDEGSRWSVTLGFEHADDIEEDFDVLGRPAGMSHGDATGDATDAHDPGDGP